VTAVLTDPLAGLNQVVFPTTTDPGQSYDLDGVANATQVHGYDFAQADDLSDIFTVTATDRAGNETTESFSVINDMIAPTAAITVPERAGLSFVVEWSGDDDAAGIREYEVQVREGEGDWTDWLTGTTADKATFAGMQGLSYTFQVRAIDNVDNEGAWVESEAVEISDTVTKYYSFGGQRACPECNRRVAMWRGAEVYFIHGDHLGSTSLTTDSAGAKVAESRYLPYGQERWSAGAGVTDFGFTSQRRDSYIKLYDYGARWYDPQIGRWISPDTIIPDPADLQSFNRYSYVRNNPVKYQDPTGHAECVDAHCEDLIHPITRELIGNKEFVKLGSGEQAGEWVIEQRPTPPNPELADDLAGVTMAVDALAFGISLYGTVAEVSGAIAGGIGGAEAGAAEGGIGAVPGAIGGATLGGAVMNAACYQPVDKAGDTLGWLSALTTILSDYNAGNTYVVKDEKGYAVVLAPGTQFAVTTAYAGMVMPIATLDAVIDGGALYNDVATFPGVVGLEPITEKLGLTPTKHYFLEFDRQK
jgi:RHS repeat-associated protein